MKNDYMDVRKFLSIIAYLSEGGSELIHELDSKFNSKRGHKAYPRTFVIGILMYSLKTEK